VSPGRRLSTSACTDPYGWETVPVPSFVAVVEAKLEQTTAGSARGAVVPRVCTLFAAPQPVPAIATIATEIHAARVEPGVGRKHTRIGSRPTPEQPGYIHDHSQREVEADGFARKVLGGTALTTAGLLLSRSLTLVAYLVLARLAAPEVFGVFAAGSIAVGAGTMLVDSGMMAALIQRRDRLDEAIQTAFAATLAGGMGAALLALVTAPLVGFLFRDAQIGTVAAAMSGVLVLTAGTVVPDAILQRRFSFLRRVVVDPLGTLAFAITAIAALAGGAGVWALVAATYVSALVQIVAAWVASRFRPNFGLASFAMWRELAGYGRHVLAGSLIDHVALAANTLLLGRFLTPAALGQYRYAARLAFVPQELAITAGSYVLLPALARVATERERLERGVRRSLELLLAVVVPASLLLVPLGVPLALLLLGDTWRPAGTVLAILSLASAPRAMGSVAGESLKASARPDVLPALHLFQAISAIVLMVALLPFGLAGVAAGVTLASIFADSAGLVRAVRVCGLDPRGVASVIWPPYVAGAFLVAFGFALDRLVVHAGSHEPLAGLLLIAAEGAACLIVYLACLLRLSPTAAHDLIDALRVGHGFLRRLAARTPATANYSA
jgi:O-antigen/teichoic acid export membrane protein